MRYSVMLPFPATRVEDVLPYGALVGRTPRAALWQGHAQHLETAHSFVAAAAAGYRVPVGFGVELMPLRHPVAAAYQARSVALATGQRVVAGFGPAPVAYQEMLGCRYESPLTAAREYVTIVRGLVRGRWVDMAGRYYTCRTRLPRALTAVPVDVGLGVLRPRMAQLAGEVADAAITWLTPAPYLHEVVLPALQEGARRAERPTPRLIALVPTALARPGVRPEELVLASNTVHLAAPHYRDMLARAGVPVGDLGPEALAPLLLDRDIFVHGDLDDVMKRLHAYEDAGVDELVLNLTGLRRLAGDDTAVDQLETLLDALTGVEEDI